MTTASSPAALIKTHFGELKDPRALHSIEHQLIDILIITICATIYLVLGQQKVSEKSNEITAIPALLKLLSVRGCLVSIADAIALRFPQRALHQADAMGCQTEIAKVIIEQGADYVLALKGNQGDLHTDVVQLFTSARKQNFRNIEHQFHSTVSKGHGRMETRRYWTMGNTEYLIGAHKWSGLKSIGVVESRREMNGKISTEQRYYILSIHSDVQRFATAVRSHWSIENQLHWILDVGFGEDAAQSCSGYSAENLAVIRHLGINLLSRDNESKVGVKTRRLQAGWDDNYLKTVLSALNIVTA